jgi:hypothetical protein
VRFVDMQHEQREQHAMPTSRRRDPVKITDVRVHALEPLAETFRFKVVDIAIPRVLAADDGRS